MEKLLKIFRRINEIIPHDLVLLVCYPISIGCLVNFDLVDFRYVLINIVWISIFTIPSILLKSSIPNKVGAIVLFIVGIVETTHWLLIKGPITVVSILTMGASNIQEANGFFTTKGSFLLLLVIPYFFLFVYSFMKKREWLYYKSKYLIIIVVIIGSVTFVVENAVNGRLIRKGVPQIVKVYFSFAEQFASYKQTEMNTKAKKIEAYSLNEESQTFVLIIGESLNRKHLSLYGYSRKTTPQLDNRDDIIVFKDVVSPYSNTINSVLTILSESNLENDKKPIQSIDLFDVFSSAGFNTYWLSNQIPYGIWENPITSLAKKADSYKFVNLSSNSSMEATLTVSYDAKVISPFIKIIEADVKKKLIIIQLMGSHTSYKKRYPKEFDMFKGKSDKEKTIAEYDNSVYYNDFIVDSLLNILDSHSTLNNEVASAIYLADHGENVYDELDQVGHSYAGTLPKANVEIPFVIWFSGLYKNKYLSKTLGTKDNLNKPFVSDDLFHSVIDINDIETPYLNIERSLFNKSFNDKRKRVLVDGNNYDD